MLAAIENDENVSACSLAREFLPFVPGPVFVTYTHFLVAHRVVAQLGILLQYSDGVILESLSWNKPGHVVNTYMSVNQS